MFTSRPIREAIENGNYIPGYNYGYDTSYMPRDLPGTMMEAYIHADHILLAEAISFQEYRVHADGILTEAMIRPYGEYQMLSESVFDSVKTMAVNFFKKAYGVILGIINKLKAFVYKLTGKTTKWLEVMNPRIQAAMQTSQVQNLSHTMHNWNTRYVTGDMPQALDTLHKAWTQRVAGYIRDTKELQEIKKAQAGISQAAQAAPNQTQTNAGPLTQETQRIRSDLQTMQANMPAEVGKAFRVSVNGRSMDDVWNNVVLKAQGGQDNTSEIPLAPKVSEMVTAIQNSGAMLEAMSKAYSSHAQSLKEYIAAIEREGASVDNALQGANITQEAGESIAAYVKAKYEFSVVMTREYESAMSRGNALTTQMVQSMCQEYIGALSKVANIRAGGNTQQTETPQPEGNAQPEAAPQQAPAPQQPAE